MPDVSNAAVCLELFLQVCAVRDTGLCTAGLEASVRECGCHVDPCKAVSAEDGMLHHRFAPLQRYVAVRSQNHEPRKGFSKKMQSIFR
jgi:hypothetical protein